MKLPFWLETQILKIVKPQIKTKVQFFIDGKPTIKFYGKSLNANFLQFLYSNFNKNSADWVASPAPFNSKVYVLNNAGVYEDVQTTTCQLWISAGGDWRGIVFGQGSKAVTPDVISLQSIIRHGTAPNNLVYLQQQGIQGVTTVGQNSSFIIQKIATNSSGNTITISELGIYANGSSFGNNDFILIYYDSGFSQEVLDGQTVTCQITFEITT
jgi:hypothetical protein